MANFLENRISSIVSGQLPAHIRSEYEKFVLFLEAYYEFIEQKRNAQEVIQNINLYNDIDFTITEFITYFYKTYCADFPVNPVNDKSVTLKRIIDLYSRKGSEKAVKLLFRLLYNNDVEFYYPEIQVFKSSGGRWVDRLSIKVIGNWAELSNLIGYRIQGAISGANAKVVNAEYTAATGVTELFLDRKTLNGEFVAEESIFANLPGQSNTLFVDRTFRAFYNRGPSNTETIAYVSDLEDLSVSPKQFITEIAISTEAETYLSDNLEFMKVLILQATGQTLKESDYITNYSPRLIAGISRKTIVDEVLGTIASEQYLINVLRNNDSILITANVRPVVSKITVVDKGYNYNVGDIVTVDTNFGNNSIRGTISEINYFSKSNYDSNLANALFLTHGIAKVDLENYDTINVTYANANLILRTSDLSKANIIEYSLWANDMPNLHAAILAGSTSFSYGQRANLEAEIGAMCEYPGFLKRDRKSKVLEGAISLPDTKFGGMVFRGRRDDGTLDTDLRSFISDVYLYLLDRNPTEAEYTSAASIIKKGKISEYYNNFDDIIRTVVATTEFRIYKNYVNVYTFINKIYKVCFGVEPDDNILKFYYNQLKLSGFSYESRLNLITELCTSLPARTYFERVYNPLVLINDKVYYQPFSYVLQTSENINVWSEIVKKLVHPAGLVFFGSTKISSPALNPGAGTGAGAVPVASAIKGVGSIRNLYQYLNVPIRLLKSLPTLAPVANISYINDRQIFSSVTRSNANVSYVGFGPRYETIDRWKFSYSATVDGQDEMYAQILANINISQFDADNIRQKFDITPPVYFVNTVTNPWSFSIEPTTNNSVEGRVITFNILAPNVPDGIELVYTIEQGGQQANHEDVAVLLDGLIPDAPAANAALLNYLNPGLESGYYYIDWSNTWPSNPVLAYCEMDGANISSNANGWIRVDNTLLAVYDNQMGVRLRGYTANVVVAGLAVDRIYEASTVEGIRTVTIPVPRNSRGIRVEYLNIENINYSGTNINGFELANIYTYSNGGSIPTYNNYPHFGVSVHDKTGTANSYLTLTTLSTLQNTVQSVNFFGPAGETNKRANANASYFNNTDDIGFEIDRIVISYSDSITEKINLRDLRIWIR